MILKISCVIPVFNSAETLSKAVGSCLSQTGDIEVIVVDDCSSDDSYEVALAIAEDSSNRVRVFKNATNSGPAFSRNRGAFEASGKLLCFLDSDDYYLDGFFEKSTALLADNFDSAAIKTSIKIQNENGTSAIPPGDPRLKAIVHSYPCNMVVRREIFSLLGGFPIDTRFRGPLGGEDDCFFKALSRIFRHQYLDEELVVYRNRPGSHLEVYLSRTSVKNGRVIFHKMDHNDPYQVKSVFEASQEFLERAQGNIASTDRCRLDKTVGRRTNPEE